MGRAYVCVYAKRDGEDSKMSHEVISAMRDGQPADNSLRAITGLILYRYSHYYYYYYPAEVLRRDIPKKSNCAYPYI